MKRFQSTIFLAIALCFLSACALEKLPDESNMKTSIGDFFIPFIKDKKDSAKSLEIVRTAQPFFLMEKMPCRANCQSYKITIFEDGLILYEGNRNVRHIGKFSSFLPEVSRKKLLAKINDIGYFNLNRFYPENSSLPDDLPVTKTAVNIKGKTHNIENHNIYTPKPLTELENLVDELVNGLTLERLNQ